MKHKNRFQRIFVLCNLLLLGYGLILAISLGAVSITFKDIWNSLFEYRATLETMLVRDIRIPRALVVLMTGGLLGMAGSMLQGVTRNPIAEPSILGISQGATLIIAIFYALGQGLSTMKVMLASLIGASMTGMVVFIFISKRANTDSVTRILLAGTAISTFFLSLTTIIGLLSNQSQMLGFWISGGFRNVSWSEFKLVTIVGVCVFILAMWLSPKINLINLGDDVVIGMGQNPQKIKIMTLGVVILSCAAAVAAGKNIAFLGLIVPYIVRKVLGEDYRKNIPCAFLVGAVLLTYADLLAKLVFSPYEIPIGVFTSLIGAAFFIFIARRERA